MAKTRKCNATWDIRSLRHHYWFCYLDFWNLVLGFRFSDSGFWFLSSAGGLLSVQVFETIWWLWGLVFFLFPAGSCQILLQCDGKGTETQPSKFRENHAVSDRDIVFDILLLFRVNLLLLPALFLSETDKQWQKLANAMQHETSDH